MSGDITHRPQYPAAGDQPSPTTRGLGNGRHSPTSPLKLFGQAKKKVNDIFIDIGHYIDETDSFLQGMLNRVNCKAQRIFDVNSLCITYCIIQHPQGFDVMLKTHTLSLVCFSVSVCL